MKKIYLMSAFLFATSFAFNQAQIAPLKMQAEQLSSFNSVQSNKPMYTNSTPKAAGEVIWTDDFSNGFDNWVTSTNTSVQWEIQMPAAFPYNTGVHMTTANNGYAMFDAYNLAGNADVDGVLELAESIDLSDHSIATLKFEQSYIKFVDQSFVEVSTDGGDTWSQQLLVFANVQTNNEAPVIMSVNFDTDNSDQVKIRFRYTYAAGTNQDVGYWWAVDDIEISTLADNDVATYDHEYGTIDDDGDFIYYYQIPLTQVAPITSRVSLTSQGINDQTNVKFVANETVQGNYTSSSSPISLASGVDQTVALQNAFTPSEIGNYKIEYSIEADEIDDVPSNNVIDPYSFKVTEELYARDNSTTAEQGEMAGGYWTGSTQPSPTAIKLCNLFFIEQTVEVSAIEFQFGPVIEEGTLVFGHILDAEAEELEQIPNGETDAYVVEAGDDGKYKSLAFVEPITLNPGYYCAEVTSPEVNFSVATAGISPAQTTFLYFVEEQTWYYTTSTPVIRMRTVGEFSGLSKEAVELELTTYPNPFSNETNVNFTLKDASNVSYTIVDLAGQVVANVDAGNMMAGSHTITVDGSTLANGIYHLYLNVNNSIATQKLVVSK